MKRISLIQPCQRSTGIHHSRSLLTAPHLSSAKLHLPRQPTTFLSNQPGNLNITVNTKHASHPISQPPLPMASTNSLTHVFRRWHWSRSDQTTSPFLLHSIHRPADHLVLGQSRLGRSGRCYAGTCQYSRLRRLRRIAQVPRALRNWITCHYECSGCQTCGCHGHRFR